jgi:hypothetical protein
MGASTSATGFPESRDLVLRMGRKHRDGLPMAEGRPWAWAVFRCVGDDEKLIDGGDAVSSDAAIAVGQESLKRVVSRGS